MVDEAHTLGPEMSNQRRYTLENDIEAICDPVLLLMLVFLKMIHTLERNNGITDSDLFSC